MGTQLRIQDFRQGHSYFSGQGVGENNKEKQHMNNFIMLIWRCKTNLSIQNLKKNLWRKWETHCAMSIQTITTPTQTYSHIQWLKFQSPSFFSSSWTYQMNQLSKRKKVSQKKTLAKSISKKKKKETSKIIIDKLGQTANW